MKERTNYKETKLTSGGIANFMSLNPRIRSWRKLAKSNSPLEKYVPIFEIVFLIKLYIIEKKTVVPLS